MSEIQVGQHLYTKDGRIFGNGIVTDLRLEDGIPFYDIETDFGNRVGKLGGWSVEKYWNLADANAEVQITPVEEWRNDRAEKLKREH